MGCGGSTEAGGIDARHVGVRTTQDQTFMRPLKPGEAKVGMRVFAELKYGTVQAVQDDQWIKIKYQAVYFQ